MRRVTFNSPSTRPVGDRLQYILALATRRCTTQITVSDVLSARTVYGGPAILRTSGRRRLARHVHFFGELIHPDGQGVRGLLYGSGSLDKYSIRAMTWQGATGAPQQSFRHYAILSFMRSIEKTVARNKVRVATIHPWFADTNILPFPVKLALAGIPLTPVDHIAAAIFYAATDPDPKTNGLPWVLPDEGPVFRLDRERLTLGVYGLLNQRVRRLTTFSANARLYVLLVRDLTRLFFGKGILAIVLLFGFAYELRSGLVEWPFS
ncbi:hypothetical protein FA95DRAFT_1609818 [Auriscalpium vulgare]|uniref:Uncharacterized protein n=1 Tax=Auriscalpium vulgare TaxID=40419 RepID=A0ACB8RG79_9AGAM|nr:hypothetical protein FA95DRAFT_1609818 [Auriscalpium vulgare]